MKMPFGKHKGKLLSQIPSDYIEWLLEQDLEDPLKTAVEKEAKRRRETVEETQKSLPLTETGDVADGLRSIATAVNRLAAAVEGLATRTPVTDEEIAIHDVMGDTAG